MSLPFSQCNTQQSFAYPGRWFSGGIWQPASRGSHDRPLLGTRTLSGPFPRCIRVVLCDQENMAEVWHVTSKATRRLSFLFALSLSLSSLNLEEASCHVMTICLKSIEKSMWWGTEAFNQEPCEGAIVGVVPPALRDCSLIHERPWARTIQLSHFWIPGPQ